MNKLSSFIALVAAAQFTLSVENAWSYDVMPNGSIAQAPVPGWYPPPPNRGGYTQSWQQPRHWPAPPGYYPPRGQSRAVPAAPAAAENPLSAELEQTQEQLTAKSTELDKALATLEQLRVKLQHSLESELALNQKVVDITSRQQALQARVTALTAELNTNTATLEQGRQQIANGEAQTRTLTAERDQLREDLASRNAQLTAQQTLTEERDRLRSDLASRDTQLDALNSELQKTNETLQLTQAETSASSQQLTEAGAQAETFKNELTELHAQLESQKTIQLTAQQTLTEERDRLRSDLASRDTQLDALNSELQKTNETLQLTRAETSASSQQLTEAGAQAETFKNELTELHARLESQKTTQLTAQQTLTEERDRLRSDLASRDTQLDALNSELQKTNETLQLTRAETSASSQQLTEARAQAETFKNELTELHAQLQNQKTTVLEAEKTLADMIAERDGLQADLDARGQELTQAQTALTTAQSEVDELRQAGSTAARVVAPLAADEEPEAVAVEIAALQTADLDTDKDGVPDSIDLCGETPQGTAVESTGCAADAAIKLEGVNFDDNSHELTDQARHILDGVANILSRHSDLHLQVVGHTNAQGDPARNQRLSLQRAETVRDYLVAQGVNPGHIGAVGYGGQRPIADNTTREGLRKNRRVELRSLQ